MELRRFRDLLLRVFGVNYDVSELVVLLWGLVFVGILSGLGSLRLHLRVVIYV